MRQRSPSIVRECRGAALIETAFALPLLIAFMIGILQFGIVLHASGGVRHMLGEGIRYAKVYPAATEAEVLAEARANLAGLDAAKITLLTLERGTSGGARFVRMTVRYELEPVIPFAPIPPIALNQTKTAYLPA